MPTHGTTLEERLLNNPTLADGSMLTMNLPFPAPTLAAQVLIGSRADGTVMWRVNTDNLPSWRLKDAPILGQVLDEHMGNGVRQKRRAIGVFTECVLFVFALCG